MEPRLYEDGASRSTLRLARQWARSRASVSLLVLQHPKPGNAVAAPEDLDITYGTRRAHRLRTALPWAFLRLLPMAGRADVVVSSRTIGWGLLLGRLGTWVARRPFVAIVRAAPQAAMQAWVPAPLRPATRMAYRTADRVVCITPGLVDAVLEMGVPAERVVVAVNGVDVERIRGTRPAAAEELPGGEGPLVVGIGRLEPQKGFDVLIRAHAQVVANGHPQRLLILGEGHDRGQLQRLAEDLGVADSVHMPGFAHDPLPALAAADVFCLSSRYEGFGQSLAEALVLGVPVVATDCVSGPRFLLADGAHGDLVPVDDPGALAGAVERHLADPRRLRDAARRGQEWAVGHLGIEDAADHVLDVVEHVVGGDGPRRTRRARTA